jgi:hypothetical protein
MIGAARYKDPTSVLLALRCTMPGIYIPRKVALAILSHIICFENVKGHLFGVVKAQNRQPQPYVSFLRRHNCLFRLAVTSSSLLLVVGLVRSLSPSWAKTGSQVHKMVKTVCSDTFYILDKVSCKAICKWALKTVKTVCSDTFYIQGHLSNNM